ncbi:MAG TPA: hypothetical protein VMX38_08410 [Verrucomicrobiae bacterium]|nr:hypothetical protein [Verrucomicrobiae bacterium]
MSVVAGWENFYVIVGSSAGALIGLQFVVMTLIATRPIGPGRSQGADAFATPTIVHFGTVLLLSAIACAPWQKFLWLAISYRVLGLLGMVYELIVIRRMRTQKAYQPVFEDWVFQALLPLAAYATLAASAWLSVLYSSAAMFGVAAAALILLFVGIHNAWDAVTYHIFIGKHERE